MIVGGCYFGFPAPDQEPETQTDYAARLGPPARPRGLGLGLCGCTVPSSAASPHAESLTSHSPCRGGLARREGWELCGSVGRDPGGERHGLRISTENVSSRSTGCSLDRLDKTRLLLIPAILIGTRGCYNYR